MLGLVRRSNLQRLKTQKKDFRQHFYADQKKFESATITGHFELVYEYNSIRKIT